MTVKVLVDWDNDGHICEGVLTTDALNILSSAESPVFYYGISKAAENSATVAYSEVKTDYGLLVLDCQTGTEVDGGFSLGKNSGGDIDDIGVSESTEYTIAFWLKEISATGIDLEVSIYDQDDNLIGSATGGLTLTGSWAQVTKTFTTGAGDSFIRVQIIKDSDATDCNFQVAGLMLVAGDTAPTVYNAGDASNSYDDISIYVERCDFQLGLSSFGYTANESTGTFTVDNNSKLFSPENASSPLYDSTLPARRVEVWHSDIQLYTGFIDLVTPDIGEFGGDHYAEISTRGPKWLLQLADIKLSTYQNVSADVVIKDIFTQFGYINWTTGWILGAKGSSELGSTTKLVADIDMPTLDVGDYIFSYYGDNTQQISSGTAVNIIQVINDLVKAEYGKFWIGADGLPYFKKRSAYYGDDTVDYDFDDTWQDLEYVTRGERLVNRVTITYQPRTEGDILQQDILWRNNSNIVLNANQSTTFTIYFTDESQNPAAALSVVSPVGDDLVYQSGTATISLTPNGESATLEIIAGASGAVITTLIVRGQLLTSLNPNQVVAQDDDLMSEYLLRDFTDLLMGVDNSFDAQSWANHYLARFGNLDAYIDSATFQREDDGVENADFINIDFGDVIHLTESQSGHDDNYRVFGVKHFFDSPSQTHECKLILDKLEDESPYWELGVSALGTDTDSECVLFF